MKNEKRLIYHMLPRATWDAQPADQPYRGDTLASEGFIHCTGDPELLVRVANHFYSSQPEDFVILSIDETRVQPEVKWEAADGEFFPHIYGPLNLDAVVGTEPFPRDGQGAFLTPATLMQDDTFEPARDFELTDVDGRTLRLSDYQGVKHVVLVFNRGFV